MALDLNDLAINDFKCFLYVGRDWETAGNLSQVVEALENPVVSPLFLHDFPVFSNRFDVSQNKTSAIWADDSVGVESNG